MGAETAVGPRRVLLAGAAPSPLVEATLQAFERAGDRVRHVVEADRADMDGLDVCVCFTRAETDRRLLEHDDASFDEALEAALASPSRTVAHAARAMAAGLGGSIVVVGGVDLVHAYPGRSIPSMAMGALLGLVRAVAVELSGSGVRANLVVAGPIEDAASRPHAERLQRTLLRSPMHRLGSAEEVAAAIGFVAGPDSAFMTGQTLRVDGGWASLNQAPEGMRFP